MVTILTIGCTDQKMCEMGRGARAFVGQPDFQCNRHSFIPTDLKFKVGDCVAYVIVTGPTTDRNDEIISRPTCHVSNLLYKIKDITQTGYVMTDGSYHVDWRFSFEKSNRDYAQVNCKEYK